MSGTKNKEMTTNASHSNPRDRVLSQEASYHKGSRPRKERFEKDKQEEEEEEAWRLHFLLFLLQGTLSRDPDPESAPMRVAFRQSKAEMVPSKLTTGKKEDEGDGDGEGKLPLQGRWSRRGGFARRVRVNLQIRDILGRQMYLSGRLWTKGGLGMDAGNREIKCRA
jgi:hypothetical protein